jgi:hypothetical protein
MAVMAEKNFLNYLPAMEYIETKKLGSDAAFVRKELR